MKDSITNSIIQQMLSVLDNAQLKQLKKAIEATLADYEIVKCDENKQTETDEIVIEKFLSAKRVEGCSEKSLRYYKSTYYDRRFTRVFNGVSEREEFK